MNKEKVLNLAKLARISISEEEAGRLSSEFGSILNYVSEVRQASLSKAEGSYPIRNVLRDDGNSHESGLYTEKILSQAPSREGDYIKVKKIL